MDETFDDKRSIKVVCRFRPLNSKELAISREMCVSLQDDRELNIKSTIEKNKYNFKFDKIFDTKASQDDVYSYTAKPIVDSVFEGFNGTILAYGQTSSGKTHTMQGNLTSHENQGIVPRTVSYLFDKIVTCKEDVEFTVKCSIMEIYMEKIKDLLDQSRFNLQIREDRSKTVFVEDLSEHYCANEEEVLELIKISKNNSEIDSTTTNEQSSRGHIIILLTLHMQNTKDLSAKVGKMYLVDLAGSKKISKTGFYIKQNYQYDFGRNEECQQIPH